jgi:predicted ATPase
MMEELFSDHISDVIGDLAFHYSRSPQIAKAVEYLGRAGELSLQRSAHADAAGMLRQAIDLLDSLPDTGERVIAESRLQLALGVTLQASLGYAAAEVGDAYESARSLAERIGDRPQIVSAVRGHSIFSIVRADYPTAYRLGETLRAHHDGSSAHEVEYRMILGLASLYTGNLLEGEQHFLRAVEGQKETRPMDTIQYSGHSHSLCLSYLALDVWYLGDPARALSYSRRALEMARQIAIPITLAQSQGMYALLLHTLRDYSQSEKWFDRTIAYAEAHGFPYWSTLSLILKSWLVAERSGDASALVRLDEGLTAYRQSGARIGLPWFLTLHAEILSRFGRFPEALDVLEDAQACMEESGERYHEAELHRVRGEVLLAWRGLSEVEAAQELLQRSLQVSRERSAASLELRTACSQARLCRRLGRPHEGRSLLAPLLERVAGDHESADLAEARRLLRQLADTGDRIAVGPA